MLQLVELKVTWEEFILADGKVEMFFLRVMNKKNQNSEFKCQNFEGKMAELK